MQRWTVHLELHGPSSDDQSQAALELLTDELSHLMPRFQTEPERVLLELHVTAVDADGAMDHAERRVGFAFNEACCHHWRYTVVDVVAEISGD